MAWVHGCVRPVDQAAICGGILRLKLSGNLKCNVYLFVAIFFWGILMEAAVYNKYAWFHSQLWLCWAYIKNFLWWLEDIFCSQWLFKHQSEESLERPRVEAIWEVPSHSFLWPPLLTIVNRSSFASKEGGWGRPRLVWADKKGDIKINPEWSRLRCREVTFQEDLALRREAKQRMSCIKKTRDICMHDANINVRW